METISFLSFPKRAFHIGLCKRGIIWAETAWHCKKKSDFSKNFKLKQATSLSYKHTLSQSFMVEERLGWDSFSLNVCSSETGKKHGQKKVSASCKPSVLFLPQPPNVFSHPSLLPAPLFYDPFFLLVDNTDWVTRCPAHTNFHTLKSGQAA